MNRRNIGERWSVNNRVSNGLDPAIVIIIIAAVVVLALQLLLCFKAKRLIVKLLPPILLCVSMVAFYALAVCTGGWDALDYLFFSVLSAGLILVCGAAWIIWAIIRKRK